MNQISFPFDDCKTFDDSDLKDWETPWELFRELDEEFHFTLDVCASPHNAKCDRFFTKEQDGLSRDWSGDVCFMNPPYGSETERWVHKAWEEGQKGSTVVCLLPAWTDRAWWHNYIIKSEIRWMRGRIRFGRGGKRMGSAPFPTVIVIFR